MGLIRHDPQGQALGDTVRRLHRPGDSRLRAADKYVGIFNMATSLFRHWAPYSLQDTAFQQCLQTITSLVDAPLESCRQESRQRARESWRQWFMSDAEKGDRIIHKLLRTPWAWAPT